MPTRVSFRRRSPQQHATLLRALSEYSYEEILNDVDPQSAWSRFYKHAKDHLDSLYPMPQTTMTSGNPLPHSRISVLLLLDRLHHTAEGLDGLPAWFLRTAAPVY